MIFLITLQSSFKFFLSSHLRLRATPPPLLLFAFLSPSLAPTRLTLSLVSFHGYDGGRLFFHATLDAESLYEGLHELELELLVLNVGLVQTDAHRHGVKGVEDDVTALLGLVLRRIKI